MIDTLARVHPQLWVLPQPAIIHHMLVEHVHDGLRVVKIRESLNHSLLLRCLRLRRVAEAGIDTNALDGVNDDVGGHVLVPQQAVQLVGGLLVLGRADIDDGDEAPRLLRLKNAIDALGPPAGRFWRRRVLCTAKDVPIAKLRLETTVPPLQIAGRAVVTEALEKFFEGHGRGR